MIKVFVTSEAEVADVEAVSDVFFVLVTLPSYITDIVLSRARLAVS